MKRLVTFAVLLASLAYLPSALAVPMTKCADGIHWYPTSEGASYCPPLITFYTSSPGDTTATITGTVSASNGTVYVSIRLNCTAQQWRTIHNGTGDEASGTDADVSSGAFSIAITGLSESTEYCAHIGQYTTDFKPAKPVTLAFTTTAAASPDGDTIAGGDDYFFCPDGSDANSGLTHALRKQNYPTTDTSLLGESDDMWLCTGGVWNTRKMNVARAGTSGDYSETGCYYMDGATAKKCVDNILGMETTYTKPAIRGGLTDACIAAGNCTFPDTFPQENLLSSWDGYIQAAATADYHIFQNIRLEYSRYANVGLNGGVAGGLHHVILEGVDIQHWGVNNGIIGAFVTDVVIRNGSYDSGNYCSPFRQRGTSSNTAACSYGNVPPGPIQFTSSTGIRVLIENNTITTVWSEGIGLYNNSSARAIIRNNRLMNVVSSSIYLDGWANGVVEGNVVVGGNGSVHGRSPGVTFSCVQPGHEYPNFPNAIGHVIRNNLCVNTPGIYGYLFVDSITAGKKIGAKIYGNTLIDTTSGGGDTYYQDPVANLDEWDYQNNAAWSPDLSAANTCRLPSTVKIVNDNHWYTNPSDSDCDGAGDSTGTPEMTLADISSWVSLGSAAVADPIDINWPTFADANPTAGDLLGTGTALTSAILDIANYGFAFDQIKEVLDLSLTEAEWEGALIVDALGATRANPPSKGAVE